MLRLTLAQMRRNLGRLAAAAVAVTIGTAFVAATLLAGDVMTRTAHAAVTSGFAQADLVVGGGEVGTRTADALAALPGVAAVDRQVSAAVEVVGPTGRLYTSVKAPAPHPRLEPETLTEGVMPSGRQDVALPAGLAETVGVGLGEDVDVVVDSWPDGAQEPLRSTTTLRVSGLLDDGASAFLGSGGTAVVARPLLESWIAQQTPSHPDGTSVTALVALDEGAGLSEVQESAGAVLGPDLTIRTLEETAEAVTAELTGSSRVFTAIVLGFAAVSLLVAGLVIANTFQVLVAQRRRTLALLRCVGADRSQLRRSVLTEALILGLGASVLGVAGGGALVQGALAVLRSTGTDVPLPATIAVTPAVVLVPLAVGTLVTVLAALAPAREATRVPPVAALHPVDVPQLADRAGRLRAWLSGLLVVGGAAALVGGVVVASVVDLMTGLAIGVLGGAASFIGVVVAAVFWVPRLMRVAGRLAAPAGPSVRLAAANGVRNPRRTAATSAALLIGVTLVAMMSTGAASTRTALDRSLDAEFPVDVEVTTVSLGSALPALPAQVRDEVLAVDGIVASAELTGVGATLTTAGTGAEETGAMSVDVRGVDPGPARSVLRTPEVADALDDGTVLVAADDAPWMGVEDGAEVTLAGQDDGGTPTGSPVTLRVVVAEVPRGAVLATRATVERLAPGAPVSTLWLAVSEISAAADVVTGVDAAAAESEIGLATSGAAVERAFYQRVVDTLLAVVVGLLGVAVVIALVGVANTLSLSVLERRRESATLRAIGMSRGQLRATLATEGVLISLVGAVTGAVLGTLYGWAGARTLLGEISPVALEVPWRDLALVMVVALAAGLLASVVPARTAVRTSPVEALAVD